MPCGRQIECSKLAQMSPNTQVLTIIPEKDLCTGAVLTSVSSSSDVYLTSTAMKLIYFNTYNKYKR